MKSLAKVDYPQAFNGKCVRVHWEFENDLKDILERSGQKDNFFGKNIASDFNI